MNGITTTGRINKFDNLKGFAILLIVLGHLCYVNDHNNMVYALRNFVYLFHLPIFFFVSGYFSKIGEDEPIKAFKRLFIPYIIFTILWELFNFFAFGDKIGSTIFIKPGFGLWFLISLFTMKLMLPIADRFRYPILISFIFAVLIGLIDCNILGISRTFVYFPIFLIGFYLKQNKIEIPKVDFLSKIFKNNHILILIGIISITLTVFLALNLKFATITMKNAYGDSLIIEMIIRVILLILITSNTLIAYKFMTNSKNILTKFGINSLVVYLLHLFIYKILDVNCKSYFAHHNKLFFIFLFAMTFIIVFILSRDIFTNIYNKIFNKTYELLLNE